MGAWDVGNFDNDEALDWLARLESSGVDGVREALARVARAADSRSVSPRLCVEALAAAEVVAAAAGGALKKPPEQLLRWIGRNADRIARHDIEMAVIAASRIEMASKLQQLFDEGQRDDDWHDVVQDLLTRLSRVRSNMAR
jgi:hypothetical protein